TALSTTTDGTTIRRMPNLVTFRDDPDAMLVMALEHYDERTGRAEKAAIMHHDVVGRHTPRTTVQSAEEGLLVSLDQRGVVDLPYIATLYAASVPQIIVELGVCFRQACVTGEFARAYSHNHVNIMTGRQRCTT